MTPEAKQLIAKLKKWGDEPVSVLWVPVLFWISIIVMFIIIALTGEPCNG